jgi:hypothetical protein
VSPILGIYASQISGHLFAPSGAYDSIATGVGTGSSGTIVLSSIPSTYTHLQIRYLVKTSRAAVNDYIRIEINGDTTSSNYRSHSLYGNGTTAYAETAANSLALGDVPGNTNADMYGVGVIDILDYANTSKYKTVRTLQGYDQNSASTGASWSGITSGLWMSTSAINSISIIVGTGPNFTNQTRFALYGIKGA